MSGFMLGEWFSPIPRSLGGQNVSGLFQPWAVSAEKAGKDENEMEQRQWMLLKMLMFLLVRIFVSKPNGHGPNILNLDSKVFHSSQTTCLIRRDASFEPESLAAATSGTLVSRPNHWGIAVLSNIWDSAAAWLGYIFSFVHGFSSSCGVDLLLSRFIFGCPALTWTQWLDGRMREEEVKVSPIQWSWPHLQRMLGVYLPVEMHISSSGS